MSETVVSKDFIREIINEDINTGKFDGRVMTRFPPEPNGFLHLGHAKSICLNFGVAEEYHGLYNLRFDDTNPVKEDDEFVEGIKRDIQWLGFDWGDRLYFASDYFDQLYEFALQLIRKEKAYVDSLNQEEMRAYRGTPHEPGRNSPHRLRSIEENLDLFKQMQAGEFPDGAHVLRAKIDMAHPNLTMRDPVLYRIRHADHHRTGDRWCVYPMYDFTHCISDSIEGVTHSLCTWEFENNRPLYDWILDELDIYHPQQIEFAPLNLAYTVLSKRLYRPLIEQGILSGWDDPRMPTFAGLRRRGYTPEAIRAFCGRIGVAKKHNLEFVDTDENIEKNCSMKISEIFNKKGEKFFRIEEEKEVLNSLKRNNCVISLGGGAFMNNNIRNKILENSISIWLDIDLKTLHKRIIWNKKRPLLNKKNNQKRIEQLYSERKNIYKLANHKIDCNNLDKENVVKKIIDCYEKY